MKYFFIGCLFFFFTACSNEPTIKNGHLEKVTPQLLTHSLFYTGTVQPLKTTVLTSAADGVIVEMPFQYGEAVSQQQLLFVIDSTKFLSDYKSALIQYIKAKNEFNNQKTQLTEGKFLHDHQLISDDDYKMKQSNYYAAQLALLESKEVLDHLLRQLNVKEGNLYQLTIADIDKITQALQVEASTKDQHLRLRAPVAGVVLSPTKNEEGNKKLSVGDVVKQGDVLAMIGDMSGLSVHIKVDELTINQLQVGQKVKVTGIAFPEYLLSGEIKRIDKQAEATTNALPNFSVEVVVPTLSQQAQQTIHAGMSAKIEIEMTEPDKIMIPIAAVTEKAGVPYVKQYDAKTKKTKWVAIQTGKTTMDAVAVLKGLHKGDSIVIPH